MFSTMHDPVLVTGAGGFVGRALVARLVRANRPVRAALRRALPVGAPPFAPKVQAVYTGELAPETDWRVALDGVGTIVHCAARVHVMHETASDPLAEFRRVNVEGSLRLARQAAAAGVRRFVYVSSIKVNGEATEAGRPFRSDDTPQPKAPYGIAKFEAEMGLRKLAAATGMEVVVVRPPLVYGPGVRANFRRLMNWVQRGIPLPFGAVDNRRSLVALDNLCDLLVTCTHHPTAAGRIFLAGDGEDVSTTQLLKRLGRALGCPARLVPIPPAVLRGLLGLVGKADLSQRIFGSLQVDISPTCALLNWAPVVRLDDALDAAARDFLAGARH